MITAVAAALRFAQLESVSANQFYDAAVSSMSASWHNFFFGAFDPAGILSIDKPPLDLWLEVVSVKLLGFNQFALKLPEALGGTLAVPLLYDTVRRVAGRPAGLAAAAALAVLPESVLTSRSDTMDSLMMLLVIAALWLTVRACASETPDRRAIVLAGVAFGLAFNVKLLEAMIAVPAVVVLYLLAGGGRAPPARARPPRGSWGDGGGWARVGDPGFDRAGDASVARRLDRRNRVERDVRVQRLWQGVGRGAEHEAGGPGSVPPARIDGVALRRPVRMRSGRGDRDRRRAPRSVRSGTARGGPLGRS